MSLKSKIFFSLIAASAPLAASAVVPPLLPPPAEPLFVGDYQAMQIQEVNGLGTFTPFANPGSPPIALAFNGGGNLFAVLESGGIDEYDPQGNATLFANSGLNNPNAVAIDSGGNVYVANLGGGAGQGYVEEYNSQGVGSTFAMTGLIQPSGGLAFDSKGNLYVAEEGNGTVVKYDSHGNATPFLSGYQSYAMAFYNNYLYVATPTDAIYKVDPLGNATLFANSTYLSEPTGMAFDPNGNLFVVNGANNTIAEYNQQGTGEIFATGSYLDPIAIVPEPAAWAILALGAGAMLYLRNTICDLREGRRLAKRKFHSLKR